MKSTKGSQPTNKPGGMKSHLGSSPGNNPGTSRTPGTEFGGKASKHLKASRNPDSRKSRPNCEPKGV